MDVFPLNQHYCSNDGGVPRYNINNDLMYEYNFEMNTIKLRADVKILAEKHKELILQIK